MPLLWDTDVLSDFIRAKNAAVVQRANAYLGQHGRPSFSAITRYEILRGLKAKGATAMLRQFETLCRQAVIFPVTDDIIVIASDVWATLSQRGQLIGDNDILIAATALHHGLPLATRNVAHFSRVPGLTVEDWSQP
jgi:tRNA(fMet)-specific endonuclease VapC